MISTLPEFRAPTAVERAFNRAFGFLVGLGLGFSPQLSAASARPQERKDLLNANRSVGTRRQAVPGGPAGTDAVGSQCRSSGRGDAEEGKDKTEVSPADNSGRRQAGDFESLSRQFQARSAAVFSSGRGFAAGSIRAAGAELSGV